MASMPLRPPLVEVVVPVAGWGTVAPDVGFSAEGGTVAAGVVGVVAGACGTGPKGFALGVAAGATAGNATATAPITAVRSVARANLNASRRSRTQAAAP